MVVDRTTGERTGGAEADDPVLAQDASVITIFAPGGIGEVKPGADVATAILAATDADPLGPLRDGDIVVPRAASNRRHGAAS